MTGHKKIVGLWRDSAANQEADCAAPAEAVAPETLAAPEVAAPAERDWLDMSSLNEAEDADRSEEHTSELQSLMRISYAVFCLKKKTKTQHKQQQECQSLQK